MRIAKRRLRPFGVEVLQTYCEDNGGTTPQKGALPFRTETFDVAMDRHEAYRASEVYRVLKPEGVFITQQVGGGNNAELRESLQGGHVSSAQPYWELKKAVVELKAAGFHIREQRAETKVSLLRHRSHRVLPQSDPMGDTGFQHTNVQSKAPGNG